MQISFCTSCCNRTHYLKQTLQHNLQQIVNTNHQIVVVDYGSSDDLSLYMQHFRKHANLKFYSIDTDDWHMSKAKNASHAAADGDVLFNLDCDNYISKELISYIESLMSKQPNCVLHNADCPAGKPIDFDYTTASILPDIWSDGDGTGGRIALSAKNFFKLGGYDESFGAMGYQDNDLISRAKESKLVYVREQKEAKAIKHSKCEGLMISEEEWHAMDIKNESVSNANILAGRLCCATDFERIKDQLTEVF
jgi:glycosyltransferase involved in cell wall biosynthesis